MKVIIALLTLALCAAPARAQTPEEKVNVALGIAGLSSASVALGLTMACTSAQTCRENNPLMARWIAESPVKASVVKASLNGASYYAAWRFTHGKPKARLFLLMTLTAVNTWDAVHDVRQVRQQRRPR